ncbi:chorismate mutase [Rhodospirillum rubrum]|uniref:chorismate mutase n=1 Tax=Rhodospirillum rubrum TaxID=1085 RepID=UPI001905BA51|nr:chorismate mutase [Rhodospirillum rubrum]MBK1665537.1 chorismate mutase [Rhodospirillum rubrum]MBK1678211.1 chorismate mutase [Rhodospirillum rubrum]
MPEETPSLDALRAEIDRIDDEIHDLIVHRATIAAKVRAAKTGGGGGDIFLRPGRETIVLRRLLARHAGAFPRRVLVRLWRELFSAIVSMQGRFSLAVWMPERGAGYIELARNQYGSFTPLSVHQSVGQVVREVAEGRATVGVLPLPRAEDATAWWLHLTSDLPGTPRVVARLPVVETGGLEALAIACLDPEPSGGADRALLCIESGPDASRAAVLDGLREAGFDPVGLMDVRTLDSGPRLSLVEVAGFVAPGDERLALATSGPISRLVVIGVHAEPFSARDLDGAP